MFCILRGWNYGIELFKGGMRCFKDEPDILLLIVLK